MPIIINEIIIKTNIEKVKPSERVNKSYLTDKICIDDIVKEAVDKVLEILSDRKQR